VAARLMGKLYQKQIFPVILLVAFDQRAHRYRHPLPTAKTLEKHAVVSVCGQRDGLIAAAIRMVHFGQMPRELARKADAVVKISAQMFQHTRPGQKLKDILQKGLEVYEAQGYGPEWRLHFQGGVTGYNTREQKATLASDFPVLENQAIAWKPSIAGVKSEDTFLVLADGNEMITETGDFPGQSILLDGSSVRVNDVLRK
jgi:Xaa-Pro aminopeptidase